MSVVSSVISRVSTRPTGWRINVRLSSLMDSIFAIGFGLGLRFVVDTVSNHDFKLTGTLVGLWEGVILLHFIKKTPKSSDPYIAFGVRIFIDLVFTESVARMVLVLIWTALGMVLADITPAIWEDVGLKRVWKSFRRDLYTILRMIPTVAFFPPTRTVRFSPSREPSVIADEATEILSPSAIAEQTPVDPLSSTAPRVVVKRRVPGHFSMDYSDTETDSSVRAANFVPQGRTSRRLSVFPEIPDYDDDTVSDLSGSQNDLDEANLSSEGTETGEPALTLPDASEIPEIEEEPLLVDVTAAPVKPEDGEVTPTQRHQPYMPPTPSDSAARWGINRDIEEPLPVRPPSELLPQIPDFLEEPASEDWEKIQHADYSEEKPPTPPAKDKPFGLEIPKVPDVLPPVPPVAQQPPQSTTPPDDDMNGWDTMESQIIIRDANGDNNAGDDTNAPTTTNDDTKRQSLPPPYADYETHDDIYDDPPHDPATDIPTGNLIDDDTGVPPVEQHAFTNTQSSLLPPIPAVDLLDPWGAQQVTTSRGDDFEEQLRRDQEAEQLKAKQVAEEAERKAAEDAQREAEEEAEEERKKKKAQEKAEREKKEADDALARKKKREEEEAAEKVRKEEEKKRLKEEAEKKKEEELAQKKKDAEEAQARREAAAEEKRKKKEAKEEEKRKKAEEEERKEAERVEAERIKAEQEAAAKEEAATVEAERLQAEKEGKEAARLKAEEEAARLLKAEEENEAARKAEEEAKEAEKAKEEEQARLQQESEDATKLEEQLAAAAEERVKVDALKAEQDTQKKPELEVTTQGLEAVSPPGETTEDVKTPVVRPTEGAAEPPEYPLSPAELNHAAPSEVADTVSEVSEAPPRKAHERVKRMLSLRAQIVEIEANLKTLIGTGSDPSNPEVRQMEKILRKMNRQAERRYASGISYHQLLDDETAPDTATLGTLNDIKSQEKIAEKIEQLLTPTSRSLYVSILYGKKQNDSRKQKGMVTRLMETYNLTDFSFETSGAGKKGHAIDVSKEKFADWVTGYRKLSTRVKKDEFESVWAS